jgi:long-chain acyl-CoA synthetase
MMEILEFIENSNFNPYNTALVTANDTEYSYWKLVELVRGESLDRLHAGDRIIIMNPHADDVLIAFLSALHHKYVPVIVNPKISQSKLDCIIDDCKPAAIYKANDTVFIHENINTTVTDKAVDFILYTSGSQGEQKGVLCTLESAWEAIRRINEYLIHWHGDIVLSTLPLHHSYGLYQALCMFACGGTLIHENGFKFPAKVLERVKKYGATGLPLVPTSVAMMLGMKGGTVALNCKSLRYITTAGANLPQAHEEELQALLPNTKVIPMYGQTECVRIAWKPRGIVKPGSVGIIMAGMKAVLMDEDGWPIEEPGKIGELVVTGPNLMNGYLNRPLQEKKTFVKGWLRTGDMFYKDDDNYYWFCSRSDDIIKVKGEKVSPIEVESVINTMPGVLQAIVTSMPDEISENAITVHVVLDNTLDLGIETKDIMRFCKQNLENYLMPKNAIIWENGFPLVKGSSKINRSFLKNATGTGRRFGL